MRRCLSKPLSHVPVWRTVSRIQSNSLCDIACLRAVCAGREKGSTFARGGERDGALCALRSRSAHASAAAPTPARHYLALRPCSRRWWRRRARSRSRSSSSDELREGIRGGRARGRRRGEANQRGVQDLEEEHALPLRHRHDARARVALAHRAVVARQGANRAPFRHRPTNTANRVGGPG
jgi:hypothetical protein